LKSNIGIYIVAEKKLYVLEDFGVSSSLSVDRLKRSLISKGILDLSSAKPGEQLKYMVMPLDEAIAKEIAVEVLHINKHTKKATATEEDQPSTSFGWDD